MKFWRKIHGYVALSIFLPLLFTALTGIVLQLRDQFEWIQPAPVKSQAITGTPLLTLEAIAERFKDQGLEQIIYKPAKGSLVVRLRDDIEAHLHPQTGALLKQATRRTTFLIELHQGSWLGKFGQYGVHVTTGLGLLFLIVSGLVIYPFKRKIL